LVLVLVLVLVQVRLAVLLLLLLVRLGGALRPAAVAAVVLGVVGRAVERWDQRRCAVGVHSGWEGATVHRPYLRPRRMGTVVMLPGVLRVLRVTGVRVGDTEEEGQREDGGVEEQDWSYGRLEELWYRGGIRSTPR
ncbi:hypothetical protein AOQ84DRAFT_354711, partial [Glonium stellatum]